MNGQKFVIDQNWRTFTLGIQDLLSEGWRVVPGTLVCAMSQVYSGTVQERWAVVMEKELSPV